MLVVSVDWVLNMLEVVPKLQGDVEVGGIRNQLSNEKNLGCLWYIGDEILPSYIGHYNKP